MNSHHRRGGRDHFGRFGSLATFLLTALGLPLASAQPEGAEITPPSGFQTVEVAPIVQRIDNVTTAIIDAFNRRDRDAYLGAFTESPLVLPEGAGLTAGQSGISEMYLQTPAGLVYEPMIWSDRQFFQIDRWIIEAGLVKFQFRLHPGEEVLNDPRQAFTIWEEGADGSLRVKLLAWNRLADTSVLNRPATLRAFAFSKRGNPPSVEGDFSAVLEAEETFHRAFELKRVDEAVRFYADKATLIALGKLPLHGRAAILHYLQAIPPGQTATKIERKVAHVEGNENLVLVVNLFRWTFVPHESDAPVAIAGKGVHLWLRDGDGTWRILFDLPNVSQPGT